MARSTGDLEDSVRDLVEDHLSRLSVEISTDDLELDDHHANGEIDVYLYWDDMRRAMQNRVGDALIDMGIESFALTVNLVPQDTEYDVKD